MANKNKINVSVIGASGYSGVELLRLLSAHPFVEIKSLIGHTSVGKRLSDVALIRGLDLPFVQYSDEILEEIDLVFVALPGGEALELLPKLKLEGKRIIDLGGDFRLRDITEYERYYKREHTAMDLLRGSVYGLPEWNATSISDAMLVANPG